MHCFSSRLFGSTFPPGSLRVPLKELASDVEDRFPQRCGQSKPSQTPSPDGDFNPLLIGTLSRVLIRDHLRPPDSQDVPESTVDEGLKFDDDTLGQSPSMRSIKEDRLDVGIGDPQFCPQREIHLDIQKDLSMQKAACAFLHPASTASFVPPVVVIRLPMYVKAVTCSRALPPQVMSPVIAWARILTSFVLDELTLGLNLAACS